MRSYIYLRVIIAISSVSAHAKKHQLARHAKRLSRKTATATTTATKTPEMHAPEYNPTNQSLATNSFLPQKQQIRFQFSTAQSAPSQHNISDLIAQKIANREFFYGIEVAARSFGPNTTVLDYSSFGAMLPLFTSLIWLGQDYCRVDRIGDVESIRLAQQLLPQTVVMPHFTCYRIDEQRLSEMLALNFTNILVLRGDQVEDGQRYQHASELVTQIRRLRGYTISIGVGGYPEGHPDSKSLEEDMLFLFEKVNAGADFIITQICFSAEAVIKFVQSCRANGITVPILMGVFIPENLRTLQRMVEITEVKLPPVEYAEYKARGSNPNEFRKYAVQKAVQQISAVLDSAAGVYGVQFFTMNQFKNIQLVLAELNVLTNKVKS